MNSALKLANTVLLLSVKPRYAAKLLDGSKTTELRRVRPKVTSGDAVLFYETSPTMAIIGFGVVDSVSSCQPSQLWHEVSDKCGIDHKEFFGYFCGADVGYAINFRRVESLMIPITLEALKLAFDGFHPPQSYRYICSRQLSRLCSRTDAVSLDP